MHEKIESALQFFINELKHSDAYFVSIGSDGYAYKWASIRHKNTNDVVMTFRGRTYSDLLENIRYAWAAHNTIKLGLR